MTSWISFGSVVSVGLLFALVLTPSWPCAIGAVIAGCIYVTERVLEYGKERRARDFDALATRLIAVEALKPQIARIQNKVGIS